MQEIDGYKTMPIYNEQQELHPLAQFRDIQETPNPARCALESYADTKTAEAAGVCEQRKCALDWLWHRTCSWACQSICLDTDLCILARHPVLERGCQKHRSKAGPIPWTGTLSFASAPRLSRLSCEKKLKLRRNRMSLLMLHASVRSFGYCCFVVDCL